MTWFNVMQCVAMELFPKLSARISECVQEKLLKDSTFKMDDICEETADDVLARLMDKRPTNNAEITYLKALVQRAREHHQKDNGIFYHFQFNASMITLSSDFVMMP